jgi:hypothetical protein
VRQHAFRTVDEFVCDRYCGVGVGGREAVGRQRRVLKFVALSAQRAEFLERAAELLADGDVDGVVPASGGRAQPLVCE